MKDTQANPEGNGKRFSRRNGSRPSVVLRLGLSIGAIAMLAVVSIFASIAIAEMSTGEARAINLAGSLRMQAFSIGIAVAQPGDAHARFEAVEQAISDFTARYTATGLVQIISDRSDDSKLAAYREIGELWDQTVRPHAREAARDGALAPHFVAEMHDMVAHVDRLVVLIEQSLESKLQLLRVVQGLSLVVLLLVGSITVYHLREKVLLPLRDLLDGARAVRRGDFSVHVAPREPDELGQLGEAFNVMVVDLSEMYADLESRVRQKTDELARSNRSLELLYDATRKLSEQAATRDTLHEVLRAIEGQTGALGGAILLTVDGQAPCAPIASDTSEAVTALLVRLAAGRGAAQRAECVRTGAPDVRLSCVLAPLSDGESTRGALALVLPPEADIADWQLQLVETVARHVAAALAAAQRHEERHRLALLDERSVIARELHDSLAQALSFLNIQVTRLQKLLPQDAALEPARDVLGELREGLNDAYRQLRQLLTTFRLRIDGRGLHTALADTVQEFTRRSGLQIDLRNRLPGIDLTSSQEIHVLQVIREALSNIEHHAQARKVSIRLERLADGRIQACVEDDGIGIEGAAPRPHRYGLSIMRDRALSLNGDLTVSPLPHGGTRVMLEFPGGDMRQAPSPERLGQIGAAT